MTFAEILRSLRRRWWYLVVAVVLGGGISTAVVMSATPQYESSATMYFSVPVATSGYDLAQGGNYAQQQLSSYADLATKPIVLDPVIRVLGLDESAQKLASSVTSVASANTVLVTITVADPNAKQAALIANTIADQTGQTVRSLSPKSDTGNPTVDYALAGRAVAPRLPSTPRTKLDIGAGILGGLLLGLIAAIARDRLDTRVWEESDLEPNATLGRIPFEKGASRPGASPLITDWAEASARAEAFRQLRTTLQFVDVDNPVRVITVTSSLSGDGKSGVTANLAVAFAEAGHRVLLVDADLRQPSAAEYFGLDGTLGLTNVLAGQVEAPDVIQEWGDKRRLSVLPAGTVPPNPSELLGSRRMAQLLQVFRREYDIVLIDTPPLLPVTDAAVLSVRADGALMVARFGKTKRGDLKTATEALQAVDAKIVGVVMNRVRVKSRGKDYGYYGRTSGRISSLAPAAGGENVGLGAHGSSEVASADAPEPDPARFRGPARVA